jgi:hypothetical protein
VRTATSATVSTFVMRLTLFRMGWLGIEMTIRCTNDVCDVASDPCVNKVLTILSARTLHSSTVQTSVMQPTIVVRLVPPPTCDDTVDCNIDIYNTTVRILPVIPTATAAASSAMVSRFLI